MQQQRTIDWFRVNENHFRRLTKNIAGMGGSTMRILMVVSSPEDRTTYKAYLENSSAYSFLITEATSLEQAYALSKESQPQCIIVDYSFAGAGTPRFIDRLAMNGSTGNGAVVLLVEAESINRITGQLKSSPYEFLCKDYLQAEQLSDAIQRAVAAHQRKQTQPSKEDADTKP